ncbi:MAG: DUF2723 domain-containing protein [Acidobacteriota bacterium]
MTRRAVPAAIAVTAVTFALYRATLLPGFDFGDTGSFQTMVGSPIITPRDGYPLYFAVSAAFLRLVGGPAAHSLNLASAAEAAIACGLLTLVASAISGSVVAGVGSALLFAGSYTFWSQSIIAEVYALHMLAIGLTLGLLLRWEERPTLARLGTFFAVYAVAFGNHLSMILLAPAYTIFLLAAAPRGWRSLLTWPVITLALAAAAAGALQYGWNLRTLWFGPHPPDRFLDAVRAGWFDITKSDWRESMALQVPSGMAGDHAAMYRFDLLQQFGWGGVLLAAIGVTALATKSRRRTALLATAYIVNVLFAFSYNVGDAHVFYLPSHLIVALLAAPGAVCVGRAVTAVWPRRQPDRTGRQAGWDHDSPDRWLASSGVAVAGLILIGYAGLRIYRDYPALDRSEDRRPSTVLSALTAGIDVRSSILLTDLNWQVENGLSYYASHERPEIAYARLADVLLYAPALVRDNDEIGRDVALTAVARDRLRDAYGPLIPTRAAPGLEPPTVTRLVQNLAPGTRYVLAVLKPSREFTIDTADLDRAAAVLSGGRLTSIPGGDYAALAGVIGERPVLTAGSARPFRYRVDLAGVPVEVRMESWLAADTIRRMGFGQVVAARHHALIIERGVSLVAFDPAGRPIESGYAAGIFAPQPRYLCYR